MWVWTFVGWTITDSGNAGYVYCLQALPDGRIAVGGWFNRVVSTEGYGEMEAPGLIMLNGPAILQFTAAEVLHDGTFRFSLQAEPGGNYVLESSYDLRQWTPVLTNRAYDRVLVFDDLSAPEIREALFPGVKTIAWSAERLGGADQYRRR